MTTATQKIPAGYKSTEIGVIPADWDIKTFKDICWVNQGLQIAIEKRLKNPTAKSKKYITIQYLNSGKDTEYIDDYSPSVCCSSDDILMTRTGNTGIVISGVEGVFHNNFFKINFDKKQIEKDYLLYYLKDSKTKRIILEKAGTSTIPDLNHADFYSIQIPLPPSQTERCAIATSLSDTDVLINKLETLIEKKKNIKQGAMQELLTGKRRLPGFSGEWETKKLGEVAGFERGRDLPKSDMSDEGIYKCIHYGQLFTEYKELIGDIKSKTDSNIGRFYSKTNDVLMPTSDVTPRGLATASCIKGDGVILGGGILVVRFNPGYDGLFFSYFVSQNKISILKLVKGSTVFHLYASDLANLEINFPGSDEQTAIATVLSDMDTEIEKLESQLTKYRNIKQGMMQTLLTGKIRLI